MHPIMLYGANGYTGKLIAAEAARRGLKPVLAGRNRDALDALAVPLKLTRRVFELSDPDQIDRNLDGIRILLNCAGPFSRTCAPLLEACLRKRVHYLDITGEIEVFAHCHHAHNRAQHEGVVVFPGTGFDVVPTDCVAAMLKQRLPDANHLVLGFEAAGGPSPGTARTSVEGLARGGRARIDGAVVDVPLAWKSREFVREDGRVRSAMTIPWGDVYTAFVSTGIPNIETYIAVPMKTIKRARHLRRLQWLLALRPVQAYLQGKAARTAGPDQQQRESSGCQIWGEATNAAGKQVALSLVTPNGYDLTVSASLGIVDHLLAITPKGGYYTPTMLMGAAYVLGLPGVRRVGQA
ncbi:saccharopine dehydrogenase NADP-binding domain-containing protein [Dokdonella sp.]|uniref:saccharopine dehydrogenase family protein n=1 Tax=Dokdonella sp. TaxID=2291710 RepID=UPI002D11FF00|nr:saccharopine dehydrogenase NADP-binding domain-containing protein [Dokdonella sp.]HPN78095.1 saccharopine dehydrogenase NADP-binding domain-containing protein [Dokdonella sp.]